MDRGQALCEDVLTDFSGSAIVTLQEQRGLFSGFLQACVAA
jgi:hypothetical protein